MIFIKKAHTLTWGIYNFWEQNSEETFINDGRRASACKRNSKPLFFLVFVILI